MTLLDSLLDAIVRLDGEALVMHAGEKPYVVLSSASMSTFRGPLSWGQVELSSRPLTRDAVLGMLSQMLSPDQARALDQLGAIEEEIDAPGGSTERFVVTAARGGDDVWVEVRRRANIVAAPIDAAPPAEIAAPAPETVEDIAPPVPVHVEDAEPARAGDSAPPLEPEPPADAEPVIEIVAGEHENAGIHEIGADEHADLSEFVDADAHAGPVFQLARPSFIAQTEAARVQDEDERHAGVFEINADSAPSTFELDTSDAPVFEIAHRAAEPQWTAAPTDAIHSDSTSLIELSYEAGEASFVLHAGEEPIELDAEPSVSAFDESAIEEQGVVVDEPALMGAEAAAAITAAEVPAEETESIAAEHPVVFDGDEPAVIVVEEPATIVAEESGVMVAEEPVVIAFGATAAVQTEEFSGVETGLSDEPSIVQMTAEEAAPQPEPEPQAEAEPEPEPVSVVVPHARPTFKLHQPPPTPPAPAASKEASLIELLRVAASHNASTVYAVVDTRPMMRLEGQIALVGTHPSLAAGDVERFIFEFAPRDQVADADPEWTCNVPGVGRVRCVTFHDHSGAGIIVHLPGRDATTADAIGVPADLQTLCAQADGLVVVAGPRSSGKSTLLSAFVDLINRTRYDHVITIESQIRRVHEKRLSFISQREVRGDGDAIAAAARAALREGPDVLVIEDLRAPEALSAALDAARAGRLVFGSISALTAPAAVQRLIDGFPADRRPQVRASLAGSLRAVIAQLLVPKAAGGRTAAREVLFSSPAVRKLVLDGATDQLPIAIESGRSLGMRTMVDSLGALVRESVVEIGEACACAPDRGALIHALERDGIDVTGVERRA